jgi:hypothetical protein
MEPATERWPYLSPSKQPMTQRCSRCGSQFHTWLSPRMRTLRRRINELLGEYPYSDAELVQELALEGIKTTRKTVSFFTHPPGLCIACRGNQGQEDTV